MERLQTKICIHIKVDVRIELMSVALCNFQFVCEMDRIEDRLDVMISVRSFSNHAQTDIDLCRTKNFQLYIPVYF